ncbi:MAG: glycosyltransferase family 2 protein [Firmicutes bacterium]|nr:glycosyltransferase family 2 protein [Bacillota bacterium]
MKYGMIVNGKCQEMAGDGLAGFYQWLNVFQGRAIQAEEALNHIRDGAYDLIHFRLIRENLTLIHQLRERLGNHSNTKIIVSLDIPAPYWEREIGPPVQLKEAVLKADFVFGTEFCIAQTLAEISGKKVYEVPHPVNIEKIKAFRKDEKGRVATVLAGRSASVLKYIRRIKKLLDRNEKIRVLAYGDTQPGDLDFYRKRKIDLIICRNERELCERFAQSRFILIPETQAFSGNEYRYYESLVVYAAALGIIVLGPFHLEAMRRCFSEMANTPAQNRLPLYCWIKADPERENNLIENARVKAEYYSLGNVHKRLLNLLYQEANDRRFVYRRHSGESQPLFNLIRHVYGAQFVSYGQEEFAVVCLVKNGAEYIKAFINHYCRMGAKHFFFIDNGSMDETIVLLKQYPNVTIFETDLPHKKYECEIRRAVIEEHCRNNWCLCVDIDEFFDYPCSESVSMRHFLRYLNSRQYTAVLAYLLEMFSKELEFSDRGVAAKRDEDLIDKYCYYDISNIQKRRYDRSFIAFSNYNKLSDPGMANYSGGIRRSFFKSKDSGYLLTKHPLIFVDSKLEPVVHPHYCNKAFIADVNGVLKHYKFTSSFKDKVLRSLEAKDYCYYAEREYQEYYKAIKDKSKLSLYSPYAQKLENVAQLVRQGFLRASRDYLAYAKRGGSSILGGDPDEPAQNENFICDL